ncbi:hypothetical protein RUND412_001472 [Rhizina undulata]
MEQFLSMPSDHFDTIVIGTGNAGFTAATTAATEGSKSVLLIDKCPPSWVGGNSYFTAGAYRTVFHGLADVLPLVCNVTPEQAEKIDMEAYTEAHFMNDLMRVTGGRSHKPLAEVLVKDSRETIGWLAEKVGVQFTLSFNRQAYLQDGRHKFWGGMVLSVKDGGKGLIADHVRAAEKAGVKIWSETPAVKLILNETDPNKVVGLIVLKGGVLTRIYSSAVIFAAGGFEADPKMRAALLGPGWDLAHVRGTPYNTGDGFEILKAVHAKETGNWSGCHSTTWDANSDPNTGNQIITNQYTKSGYPLGIMVNIEGTRFVDEGVDFRNFTYAKFGREILKQLGGVAFQVWDSRTTRWLREEEYADDIVEKIVADTLEELAAKCEEKGLTGKDRFLRTLAEYNAAVNAHREEHPDSTWDPAVKDGLSTQSSSINLDLPKSNWALPIDRPPFMAVKVTCGVTFTFGGVQIDPKTAGVVSKLTGKPIKGLFACGEMVGGLFWGNYPGGSGLTAGSVFGRRAGKEAAILLKESAESTMPTMMYT